MKYVVPESRLDKIIDIYLAEQLEPSKIVRRTRKYVGTSRYWIKSDKVIGEFEERMFFINEDIFDRFMGLFSLSSDEAEAHIKRYLRKYHNLHPNKVGLQCLRNSPTQAWYDEYMKKKNKLK